MRNGQPPRVMGNCVQCCYATRKRENGSCVCTRYPKWTDVQDMHEHFCGEFVSKLDYRAACVGKW